MYLNHPENILTLICGKIVFQETSPWCKKAGDCSFKKLKIELLYDPAIQLLGTYLNETEI